MPAAALPQAALQGLPHKAVSDLKRDGWRGVMRSVDAEGQLVMTNHNQPEAVILSLAAWRKLSEQASRAAREDEEKLARLSSAFDADLAVLRQAKAGERLREAFNKPLRLRGKALAGSGY